MLPIKALWHMVLKHGLQVVGIQVQRASVILSWEGCFSAVCTGSQVIRRKGINVTRLAKVALVNYD